MLRVMDREELPHVANMFVIGRLQLISPGKRNLLVRLFVGRCLSWIESQVWSRSEVDILTFPHPSRAGHQGVCV